MNKELKDEFDAIGVLLRKKYGKLSLGMTQSGEIHPKSLTRVLVELKTEILMLFHENIFLKLAYDFLATEESDKRLLEALKKVRADIEKESCTVVIPNEHSGNGSYRSLWPGNS